jgi:prolyl 4-hydroxylase
MITIIDDILTKEECYQLIGMAATRLETLDVLKNSSEEKADGYRIAEGTWITPQDSELVTKLKNLAANTTGIPIENQEGVHVIKYAVGGEYKSHHDFFHPNTNYYDSAMENGGQRIYSCLFYLNENFEGGETDFPIKKLKVTPKTGRMLIWANLKPDGSLDSDSLHAGLPVVTGNKWIAVIWIRKEKRT